MAKDFDFRRPSSSNISRPPQVQPRPLPVVEKPNIVKPASKSPRKASWFVAIIILGVFAVLFALYYQSLNISGAKKSNVEDATTTTTTETEKKELIVDVFDGGAGAEVVTTTITKLKDAGFEIKDAGKTQFEYDKTYIWYVSGFEADAEKVAELLSDRKTVLKESQVSGSFTIQIQLGKE